MTGGDESTLHDSWRLRLAILTALLAALLPGPAPITAQEPGPEYVVEAGDSLYTTAARFGMTAEALQAASGLADLALIVSGQVLSPFGS